MQLEFKTIQEAKNYCISLGKILDIKFIENNNGYGYSQATKYLLNIDNNYFILGSSFSPSKARSIFYVTNLNELEYDKFIKNLNESPFKLRDDTGYPHYKNVKDDFLI